MNVITDNAWRQGWKKIARRLPRPRAILCVSAHWETRGCHVGAADRPATIHDFYGFPQALFEQRYPAPGSPELADRIADELHDIPVQTDEWRGLDHGVWSVLAPMFPWADIPVVPFSLDRTREPAWHYEMGRRLGFLRREGVLVAGSGNIVHALGEVVWREDVQHDWAVEFDAWVAGRIEACDHEALIHYEKLGEPARRSVPTNEHFLPLLYILGMQQQGEQAAFFNEGVTMGALSMRSVLLGGQA
jgi:4,5-DOPA dioxygenase extradiol